MKNRAILNVTQDLLKEVLKLKQGIDIIGVNFDPFSDNIQLALHGECFEEVPEGATPSIVSIDAITHYKPIKKFNLNDLVCVETGVSLAKAMSCLRKNYIVCKLNDTRLYAMSPLTNDFSIVSYKIENGFAIETDTRLLLSDVDALTDNWMIYRLSKESDSNTKGCVKHANY